MARCGTTMLPGHRFVATRGIRIRMKKTASSAASSVLDDGMSLEGSAAEPHRAVVHHFAQLVDPHLMRYGVFRATKPEV